ncbi:MAG: hypothetical protein M0C28_46590 [Candidatus Moduliflexus flocculans]|nr:hypothetical protein [Candidatus Moduliflexus flocculans]
MADDRGARHRDRDRHRARGVHQPRRGAQELAAEPLQGPARASPSTSCRRRCRTRRSRSTIETGNSAIDARANAALFQRGRRRRHRATRRRARYRLAFEYREAGGLSVRKLFTIDPAELHGPRRDRRRGGRLARQRLGGHGAEPGRRRDLRGRASYIMGARANLYRDGKVERHDAAALLKQPVMEGQLRLGRRRRSLLPVGRAVRARATSAPSTGPSRRRTPRAGRSTPSSAYTVNLPGQAVDATFFLGPKAFNLLKSHRRGAGARDRLRHVRVSRGAAARRAELGERLRRQLRLVDHRPRRSSSTSPSSRSATRAWCR